jgi:hypothetical protein
MHVFGEGYIAYHASENPYNNYTKSTFLLNKKLMVPQITSRKKINFLLEQ